MASHKVLGDKKRGFTLIEIVISMGILSIIAGVGAYIAIEQYRSYILDADKNTIITLLQKARANSINNINESDHGFAISGQDYILFEGASYASRNQSLDYKITKSAIINTSGLTEVVWKRLSGKASTVGGSNIEISNGYRTRTITLNNEGRITW